MDTASPRTARPGGRGRSRPALRRLGYVAAAAINVGILAVLHLGEGWQRYGFLSGRFDEVVGILTVSLVVGLAFDVLYLATDPPWLRRLGDAVTAVFACIVVARLWVVFPFDLTATWTDGRRPLRFVIGLLSIATGVAAVVNVAALVSALALGVGEGTDEEVGR